MLCRERVFYQATRKMTDLAKVQPKGTSTLQSTCLLTLSIGMSHNQCERRVDKSGMIFLGRSTCQADRHSVSFNQRMPIDRLWSGCMSSALTEYEEFFQNIFALSLQICAKKL